MLVGSMIKIVLVVDHGNNLFGIKHIVIMALSSVWDFFVSKV